MGEGSREYTGEIPEGSRMGGGDLTLNSVLKTTYCQKLDIIQVLIILTLCSCQKGGMDMMYTPIMLIHSGHLPVDLILSGG